MPDVKPMLAGKADLDKLSYPLVVQPKLDGIRAMVVNGKLLTRTLKPVPNAEIAAALSHPRFDGLDGELIVGEPTADDAYRRTTSFVMAQGKTDEPWQFHAFDLWNHDGTFMERHAALTVLLNRHTWTNLPVTDVLWKLAHDQDALDAWEARFVQAGYEGVILRRPTARYKFGRATANGGELLKLKRFIDFEAEVVGVYEEQHNANPATRNELGRTQRSSHKAGKIGKGTLGGLVLVALNGPCEGVEFRCGSGFTADERRVWAESDLTGRVAKVKSFPVGVKDKPRHPVFLGWRPEGA